MTPSSYAARINNLRNLARKLAFSPAGAPMDPAMMGGAPMPPMDPAMMGAAPMPPMDPAMAGGAPMPPVDPAMMAGGAPMPPMDPAMMGATPMPPMDPAMTGGAPADPAIGELLDMVQAIGFMVSKLCAKLDIPLSPEDAKQNAEEAMLQEDKQAELDAQQAADADTQAVLSPQAEESLAQAQPGYLQDTLNSFNNA